MVRSGHPNAVILNIRGYLVIKPLVVKLLGLVLALHALTTKKAFTQRTERVQGPAAMTKRFLIQKVQRNEEIDRFNIVNICIE